MSIKLNSSSGSITLTPQDGSGDAALTVPRAGWLSTKAEVDALGIAATSVTGSQASAITANTAKAGITSSQASAITANTAKVTNYNQTKSDIDALGIAASSITGALPAISGAALTNLPASGATSIDGLSDATVTSNTLKMGTNAGIYHTGTNSTSVGINSNKGTSGSSAGGYISAFGTDALRLNRGSQNDAFGARAMYANTTGSDNAAFGNFSLYSNVTGSTNTSVGVYSLGNSLTSNNIAMGRNAGYAMTTGHKLTALGTFAMDSVTTGVLNVGIGYGAGDVITTGSNNTVIGDLAGTTTMSSTVLIGAGTTERLKVTSSGLSINGTALPPMRFVGGSVGIGSSALLVDDGSSNYNVAIGNSAMNYSTTSSNNAAVGSAAMSNITTGTSNVAVGANSLTTSTTGTQNAAVGFYALKSSTGNGNTALGYKSLESATTSSSNLALGKESGASITTGSNNTVIGSLAGSAAMSSTVLIGAGTTERLKVNSTGLYVNGVLSGGGATTLGGLDDALYTDYIIAIGSTSFESITSTGRNIAIGDEIAPTSTNGQLNIGIGYRNLKNLTYGYQNVSIGHDSMSQATTASNNVGVGKGSLGQITTGMRNVAVGDNAVYNIVGGDDNTAVGNEALKALSSGDKNTAQGSFSLFSNTTGGNNNAIGYESLKSNTTGTGNTANGYKSLRTNTTGSANTANGYNSLVNSLNSSYNTATGYGSLQSNTYGNWNTASGKDSLPNNTTGSRNIGIGNNSGNLITTGSNNTVIGELSGTATMADTVLIGAGTTERLKVNSTGLYVNGVLSGGGGVNITSNATAPSSPAVGDQWYDTTNGVLYVRVTDGTDAAWLDISSANGTAAAGGGGGAWTTLSTQTVTATGVTSVEVTGLDTTYDTYKLVLDIKTEASNTYKEFRILYGDSAGYLSGGTSYFNTYTHNGTATAAGSVYEGFGKFSNIAGSMILGEVLIKGIGVSTFGSTTFQGVVLKELSWQTYNASASILHANGSKVLDRLKLTSDFTGSQAFGVGSTFTVLGLNK